MLKAIKHWTEDNLDKQDKQRYSATPEYERVKLQLADPLKFITKEVPETERGTFTVEADNPHAHTSTILAHSTADLSRLDPGG